MQLTLQLIAKMENIKAKPLIAHLKDSHHECMSE